jgi:hypothetical protein
MGLGGILQELKTEGVLALYHDYRSGRLVDYSGNGNNGTGYAANFNKVGCELAPAATSRIEVAQNASINIAVCSIIAKVNTTTLPPFQRIAAKRGALAGSVQFEWLFWNDSAGLFIFDTVGTSYLTIGDGQLGRRVYGVSIGSGVKPKGYKNGVYTGDYSANITITSQNVDPLTIGNANISYTPAGYNTLLKNFEYFLFFSRVLTATEHARLYGQLENMRWNTKGLTPGPMMP